jgi:uncharacterized membrane protein
MTPWSIKKPSSTRFIELDVIRGFALMFMILLHLMWDLDYFGILKLNAEFYQSNVIVQVLFFTIVGVCQSLKSNLQDLPIEQRRAKTRKMATRGLYILGCGGLISIATFIVMPDRPIFFGVLHCIGLSILLSIPLVRLKEKSILIALPCIVGGIILGNIAVENPSYLQLILGLHPSNIMQHTIDYFPILPWFGVTMLGVAIGSLLYKDNRRHFWVPEITASRPTRFCSWCGRHTLSIYLIHQPLIAGVLTLRVFF